MVYVGPNVHWRQSTFCILDGNGRHLRTRAIRGTWDKVLTELARVKGLLAICFEATRGYGYLHEQLRTMTKRVVVAHPGQLRLIFRSRRKNDRADAAKLAKLLFLDEVPPVYVPSVDVRAWQGMNRPDPAVTNWRRICRLTEWVRPESNRVAPAIGGTPDRCVEHPAESRSRLDRLAHTCCRQGTPQRVKWRQLSDNPYSTKVYTICRRGRKRSNKDPLRTCFHGSQGALALPEEWCGWWDSNPHGLFRSTRPSTWRVCQFRHIRAVPHY